MTTEGLGEADWTAGSDDPPSDRSTDQYAEDVAAAMCADAERVRRGELERALGELDRHGTVSDRQREALEEMTGAIVAQLLAAPVGHVRRGGDSPALDTVVRLFELDIGGDETTHERRPYRPGVPSDDD